MVKSVIRKILHNPESSLPLLIGFILTAALAASIPLYSAGSLMELLVRDMETLQIEENRFPGNYVLDVDLRFGLDDDQRLRVFDIIDQSIGERLSGDIPLPLLSMAREVNTRELRLGRPDLGESADRWFQLASLSDSQSHVEMIYGRAAEDYAVGGVLELMVSERALLEAELVAGLTYEVHLPGEAAPIPARVVGVFGASDPRDPYWFRGMDHLGRKLVVSPGSFETLFLGGQGELLSRAYWAYAYDYRVMDTSMVAPLMGTLDAHRRLLSDFQGAMELEFAASPQLEQYINRRGRFNLFLAMLILPVLILLAFYILMLSRLIIERERNEIAMLQGRGAGPALILRRYLLEYGILAAVAVLIGPFLGLAFCRLLGSSSGFMEFVSRSMMDFRLGASAFLFSAGAGLLLVLLVSVPTYRAARTSIVELKSRTPGGLGRPGWQRWFVDLGALGASAYGLYRYRAQIELLRSNSADVLLENLDPLLFLLTTVFILGAGLLFLRFFPRVISLVFRLGRARWKPASYMALLNLSRMDGRMQFLMLFVLFSIAVGMFNANAARILNANLEEDIRYRIGADLRIMPEWVDHHDVGDNPWASQLDVLTRPRWEEPPRDQFRTLPGIREMTPVYLDSGGQASIDNQWRQDVQVMGLRPSEFGRIAWFRDDLLPWHWFHYLNLLSASPDALLVSSDLSSQLQAGQSLVFRFGDGQEAAGTVYAFVEHWPGWDPGESSIVVANLEYLQNSAGLTPYEFWLSREEAPSDRDLYEAIENREIGITRMENSSQELVRLKNDALVQGINGALTLSFLVTMLICSAGFILYLLLSLRDRRLQFGVVRAMGLGPAELSRVPAIEMLSLVGSSLVTGVFIGALTTLLFGPLMEILAGNPVLPFRVLADSRDYLRIYLLGVVLAVGGSVLLQILIRRLNVSAALKLGEG